MRTVLFQNIKRKMSEAVILLSQNKCSSNSILDFANKLMEGTKKFCKFLEDISKEFGFIKLLLFSPYIY